MMFPKDNAWRCQEYLNWVEKQPSCISWKPSDDAHHMKGHGMGGSVKAPDWATMPLTREEHATFHSIPWTEWEKNHGSQWEHVARTLGKAIQDGIISIKGDK